MKEFRGLFSMKELENLLLVEGVVLDAERLTLAQILLEARDSGLRTFFITGTADMMVMASMWVKPAYKNCKGPAVYASLRNAVHTTCCVNPAAYSGYAIAWFDAWLKGDADAMNVFRSGGALSQDRSWKDFSCKGI